MYMMKDITKRRIRAAAVLLGFFIVTLALGIGVFAGGHWVITSFLVT